MKRTGKLLQASRFFFTELLTSNALRPRGRSESVAPEQKEPVQAYACVPVLNLPDAGGTTSE